MRSRSLPSLPAMVLLGYPYSERSIALGFPTESLCPDSSKILGL
jgi:hypothetical protein